MTTSAYTGWGFTALSARAWKIAIAVGTILALAGASIFAWLVTVAVTDPLAFTAMGLTKNMYIEPGGSSGASDIVATSGPAAMFFLTGCLIIAIADISRRRLAVDSDRLDLVDHRGVRRIPWSWQVLWIVLLFVAWVLVGPAQWIAGVLPGDRAFGGAYSLLLVPAAFASGACAALVVSLIAQVRAARAPVRRIETTRDPSVLRRWRIDLVCAAAGGAVLGMSVWPIASGSTILAVAAVLVGLVLLGVGFWLEFRNASRRAGGSAGAGAKGRGPSG